MNDQELYDQYLKETGHAPSEEELYAQYLKETGGKEPAAETPELSGIRKLLQGATGGLSDEFSGAVEAGGRALGFEGAGSGPVENITYTGDPTIDAQILKSSYQKGRDAERAGLKAAEQINPGISRVADITGAVVSPLNKLASGASLAKQAALLGGITGFGTSESDSVLQQAKDTAAGAALGGVTGKAFEKAAPAITKYLKSKGEDVKEAANWMAAKALGAERGTVKSLGPEQVSKIGSYALENKILSPLANTDDLVARNEAVKQGAADLRNSVYNQIDQAGASTFNPLDVAANVETKVGDFWRSPINKGEASQLENTLESILMRGKDNVSLKEAQKLKEELGKVAKWKNNLAPTDKEMMARDAYGVVASAIDDAAAKGAKSLNKKGLVEDLMFGNRTYSAGKGAEALLDNKVARETGNKMLGLTDWGLLGGGASAGLLTGGATVLPTVGLLGAKKAAEKYGAQNSALLLNALSKKIPVNAETVIRNNALLTPYLMMKPEDKK